MMLVASAQNKHIIFKKNGILLFCCFFSMVLAVPIAMRSSSSNRQTHRIHLRSGVAMGACRQFGSHIRGCMSPIPSPKKKGKGPIIHREHGFLDLNSGMVWNFSEVFFFRKDNSEWVFFCQTIATILIMPWRGGLLDTPMHKLRESQSFPKVTFWCFFLVPKTSQVNIPSTHHLFNPSVPQDKAPMQLSVHFGAEIFHEKVAWYGFFGCLQRYPRISLGQHSKIWHLYKIIS